MDYQQMYSLLFNAITDALRELDAQNFGLAKEILIQAQLQTEELYIEQERPTTSAARGAVNRLPRRAGTCLPQ